MTTSGIEASGEDSSQGGDGQNRRQNRIETERPDEQRAKDLEEEIETSRKKLGHLVTELDHRRHRLNPGRLVKQYAVPLAGAVVVALLLAGGAAAMRRRSATRSSLVARAKDQLGKLGQLGQGRGRGRASRQQKQAATTGLGGKMLAAAATALTTILVRRLATKWLAARPDQRDVQ